jgi:hypothetical protein
MEPTICCRTCNGAGRVAIGLRHASTLAKITNEWTPTVHIYLEHTGEPGLTLTALHKRLEYLQANGFVERRPSAHDSRAIEWRRVG